MVITGSEETVEIARLQFVAQGEAVSFQEKVSTIKGM